MEQAIKIQGQQGRLMGLDYFRMMPQENLKTVGSFFLLDHFPEQKVEAVNPSEGNSIGTHPHRGITTVTYVIAGENEHFDSLGNHEVVQSGGLQWMKAGNGIVHDEGPTPNFLSLGGMVHMMQFWLVLDSLEREDPPEYYPLFTKDIQEKILDVQGSKLRVLIGKYCGLSSSVPYRKEQFLYHLRLSPYSEFYYTLPANTELAVLASRGLLLVNEQEVPSSTLLAFKEEGITLRLNNPNAESIDVMLFGGAPFEESIFSQGPFVMGDAKGMRIANEDFFDGKYGKVNY